MDQTLKIYLIKLISKKKKKTPSQVFVRIQSEFQEYLFTSRSFFRIQLFLQYAFSEVATSFASHKMCIDQILKSFRATLD